MRGGGGGVVHKLLQNDRKTHHLIIKEDRDRRRRFLLHNNIGVAKYDDQEHDDDHDSNFHAEEVVVDDCNTNDHEPFINVNDQEEDSMERTMYWESQEALLEEILEQYKSNYSKLRDELSRHIELVRKAKFCECHSLGPNLDDCSNCIRRQIVNLLCKKGFNTTLCTSSWKKTHSIPGGKHEYIEVVVSTQGKKRKIKFLIEVEFRDEFKMAKSCKEYQQLVNLLPETFTGKPEHLNAILRVMCDAAKRSTAEKNIHLGPWRKRSFMQMKWSVSFSSSSPSTQLGLNEEDADGAKSNLSVPAANIAVKVA